MKPVVALVGRPNVGKSALFNRLSGQNRSIVFDVPGVTRDRVYAETEWNGVPFVLVDTGGLLLDDAADCDLTALVRRQAQEAIAEADVVVLVVDARQGVTPGDREVAELLRRAAVPVLLAVNKGEGRDADQAAMEFYELGLSEPLVVSGLHGMGSGDLLDAIVERLPAPTTAAPEAGDAVRVAVVGRPNVGKSSLVNRLVGQERVIVSPVSGTTRDAVDVACRVDGQEYVFVDTAGLRRRARVGDRVERVGALRALRALSRAQVAILVLDATADLVDQDRKIAAHADEAGRALVLAVNKWDLAAGTHSQKEVRELVRWQLGQVDYAPVVFVSALTGLGMGRLMDTVREVSSEHGRTVPTPVLNQVVGEAVALQPPPSDRGRALKFYYAVQVGTRPPRVVFFVNRADAVPEVYRRYLEGRLREAFGFAGTPLRLHFRRRS